MLRAAILWPPVGEDSRRARLSDPTVERLPYTDLNLPVAAIEDPHASCSQGSDNEKRSARAGKLSFGDAARFGALLSAFRDDIVKMSLAKPKPVQKTKAYSGSCKPCVLVGY